MAALVNCVKHGITYRSACPECGPPEELEPASSPLRPVLRDFALQMEYKLRKNDHKTGWRDLPVEALFKLLMLEIEEFKVAKEFFGKEEARKELVDVANFCMMLHDRLSLEEDKNSGATK